MTHCFLPGVLFVTLLVPAAVRAQIPATPVSAVYQFGATEGVPTFSAKHFLRHGASKPTGTLAQGTLVIPCLVLDAGRPITSSSGTPYVGFEMVLDPTDATANDISRAQQLMAERRALRVENHHCAADITSVVDARRLIANDKLPYLEPPAGTPVPTATADELDTLVRDFHNSPACTEASASLTNRSTRLRRAWKEFAAHHDAPQKQLRRARNLDYVLRTAIFEGHLGRGCSPYGACERNVIMLSIRNRARGQCKGWQGCRSPGDFEGVATSVAQYNIWDEYLTQISAIATCYLRDDIPRDSPAARIRNLYAQNVHHAQQILYGKDEELRELFPGEKMRDLKRLRHYYHPPAMGKCFPRHERIEYVSAAVASNGLDHAVVINRRIRVDDKTDTGYRFRAFELAAQTDGDVVEIIDSYPGFEIDKRKIALGAARGCTPYGLAAGCKFETVGRYRKPPYWLKAGDPLALTCAVEANNLSCDQPAKLTTVSVGGTCDPEMQPVAGVP